MPGLFLQCQTYERYLRSVRQLLHESVKFTKINNCPNEASAYYRRVPQNYPLNGRIFGEMGALCYQRMQRSNDSRLPGDALYF